MCRTGSITRRVRADGALLSVEQGKNRLFVRVMCASGSSIQLGGRWLEIWPAAGALDGRSTVERAAVSVNCLGFRQIGQLMCR